ncbi:MAG TPA: NRDE family protein, partial [Vicinamibacterales bacterium]
MCTLLVWKKRHPQYPIIVAANRDEFEGRPASDPLRLSEHPLVVGGRDEVAGGTWLAVSERGLIVALTNRKGAGRHDPAKRSRGLLVLECARRSSLDEVSAALRDIGADTYNPFVLVALDPSAGLVAQAGEDGLRIA